tara:strand:- start:429 stop:806 length:378 start_codon:yes stop_codon:yes gene_type:complete
MIHLTTSSSSQTIKVIPREYTGTATLKVRDDSTNNNYSYSVTPTTTRNYLTIANVYTDSGSGILKEGRFYDLTLENSSNKIIYKDKIFVTDQTINQSNNDYYSVNEGAYTVPSGSAAYDNDYIII